MIIGVAISMAPNVLQGASAYKAKVTFPEDDDKLGKTVIVGEMNPAVNLEQVKPVHLPPSK